MKLATLILTFLWWTMSYGQDSEEQSVRASFNSYKSAILNDRGEEAINFVDSRTIKYYDDVLESAKTADSAQVESLSVWDKLMVLLIRHRTSKDDILSFDGRSVLVYVIENGMVGKNSVIDNSIGEVAIDGTFAKGRLVSKGQNTPLDLHFYKEDSRWKIDLTFLFKISTIALKNMIEESGQSENEFFFSLLEIATGKKPNAQIWQPIREIEKQ